MRAAVIGYGRMGANHKRALESLGHTVTTVDTAGHADSRTIPSGIDVAVVATPPGQLAYTASETIERGIPTLVEKPVAMSAGEAQALADFAESEGVPLAVGYVERFNPAYTALIESLPRIGALRHIDARRLSPHPRRALSPVALDLASHEIVGIGAISPVQSAAQMTSADTYSGLLRLDNGSTAAVSASWHHFTKTRTLTVTGDDGTLRLDYQSQTLTLYAEGAETNIPVHRAEPLPLMWRDFLKDFSPSTPPGDAITALSILERSDDGSIQTVVPYRASGVC